MEPERVNDQGKLLQAKNKHRVHEMITHITFSPSFPQSYVL